MDPIGTSNKPDGRYTRKDGTKVTVKGGLVFADAAPPAPAAPPAQEAWPRNIGGPMGMMMGPGGAMMGSSTDTAGQPNQEELGDTQGIRDRMRATAQGALYNYADDAASQTNDPQKTEAEFAEAVRKHPGYHLAGSVLSPISNLARAGRMGTAAINGVEGALSQFGAGGGLDDAAKGFAAGAGGSLVMGKVADYLRSLKMPKSVPSVRAPDFEAPPVEPPTYVGQSGAKTVVGLPDEAVPMQAVALAPGPGGERMVRLKKIPPPGINDNVPTGGARPSNIKPVAPQGGDVAKTVVGDLPAAAPKARTPQTEQDMLQALQQSIDAAKAKGSVPIPKTPPQTVPVTPQAAPVATPKYNGPELGPENMTNVRQATPPQPSLARKKTEEYLRKAIQASPVALGLGGGGVKGYLAGSAAAKFEDPIIKATFAISPELAPLVEAAKGVPGAVAGMNAAMNEDEEYRTAKRKELGLDK